MSESKKNGNAQSMHIPNVNSGRRLLEAVFDVELGDQPDPGWPVVPGYRMVRELGHGGGGDVYLALRDGSENLCALKIIQRRITDESNAKRAWRELDVLQQLKLPFVPRVLDYGIHEGRLYFASDYIEGLPIDKHCEEQQLAIRARVELLERLARDVQHVHEQGVTHRDLKPSNVIVDLQGNCHIIDFGIANLLADDSGETITETGAIIGSPAYMSPEQARGDRRLISTRSDVYSLAAIGYRLLVGESPYASHGLQPHVLLRRVASEPPRTPRSIDSGVPRALDAILTRAAEYDPSSRLATALDLSEELKRWLTGKPVRSQRMSPLERLWLHMKLRPALSTAVTLATIALLASIFFGATAVSNAQHADHMTELRDDMRDRIFDGIVGFTKSLDDERYNEALRFLRALEQFKGYEMSDEEFVAQLDGARRNLSKSVLEATYGVDDLEVIDAADSFDQLLRDLEEAGASESSLKQ